MADYQGYARATEPDTTAFVKRTTKIGHPQGPVVFLLRYHNSKIPNPHGPLANDTSRSFQRAVTKFHMSVSRFLFASDWIFDRFQPTET